MLVYVQILGPVAMKMQTIENVLEKEQYLMFQACEKVLVCKNNIRIKNVLL